MSKLLRIETWVRGLDFSAWDVGDDEQMQWVAARNSRPFDSQRKRVLAAVQMQEENVPLSSAEQQVLSRIRDVGGAKASKWSFVDGLSACVAGDLELIARAARVGLSDFWLDKLCAEYEAGCFPHGTL